MFMGINLVMFESKNIFVVLLIITFLFFEYHSLIYSTLRKSTEIKN
jgi:hypothetical protein